MSVKDSWKRLLVKGIIRFTRTSAIIRRLYPFAISVAFDAGIRTRIDVLRGFLKITHHEGIRLIRIGDNFDGGYVLSDSLHKELQCLSIGAGTNISFDVGIASRVNAVHLYDHTISELPTSLELNSNIHFFKNGLGTMREDVFVTLSDCLKKFPESSQIILKVDIEGDEWKIFSSIDSDLLVQCQQVIIEFHNLLQINDDAFYKTMQEALGNLARSHSPVNIHPNNWGKVELISGVILPDVLEITYVRKDMLGQLISNRTENKPNYPCNPTGDEIELNFS